MTYPPERIDGTMVAGMLSPFGVEYAHPPGLTNELRSKGFVPDVGVWRQDQVADLEALDIFPALYPMHTFYWGDWHRQSVAGPERAENISPTGWLLERDIKFSIHSDAPVTFPNSMRLLHSAVNRTTRSGYVIGPEHKLSPMEGIKAMTIWPAYQHFEEGSKGSLEVGKLADFVILNKF